MKTKLEGSCSTLGIVQHTLKCLGGIGPRLSAILDADDHRRVLSVSLNPSGYDCWQDFARDYACVNLVKKYSGLRLGYDPDRVALRKFLESEASCRLMNEKFVHRLSNFSADELSLLERVRREVRDILGKFSWDAALPFCSHGPGASVGVKRTEGHQWYKYGKMNPSATGQITALWDAYMSYTSLQFSNCDAERPMPKVVRASSVAIVPKDARSSRTIAIEPLLNMFFQKGIGGLMRSRLKRCEPFIDLNDQCRNQELARIGSIDSSLATLDLSSASDSISRGLVEFLLPDDWLEACKLVRTAFTSLPGGEELFLQKFSSMGNGFTFELESIIFYALLRVTCRVGGKGRRDVSVYGDDLVVPSWAVPETIWGLTTLGFKTNVEKSFVSGPFRESCGKHFFLGRDVTPVFLKKPLLDVWDVFKFHNAIKLLAFRLRGLGFGLDARLQEVANSLQRLVPERFRHLSVPVGYGDGGFLRDFDEVSPRSIRRMPGWVEGFSVRVLERVFDARQCDEHAGLFCRLRPGGVRVTADMGLKVPLKRYINRVVRLHVRRWPSIGSWA